MYSILNAEPEPLTGVRTGVPMDLERIVTKLLAKEADARYQHVDEVPVDLRKIDLEAATGASRISTTRVTVAPDPIPVRRMRPLPIIGLAVAMLVVGFLAAQIMNVGSQQEPVVTRLPVSIPGIKRIEDPAMSPLGDRIAFQGVDSTGRAGLYEYELRPGGQLIYREGSERVARPAYSLDGRWVAAPAWGEILKYRVPQGAPQVLKGDASVFGNLKWLDDETILFTTTDGTISKISANGGESEVVLAPDAASGHASLLLEDFFPDRRRVLISIQSRGEHNAPVALGVGDIEAQTYEILEASACCGKHVDGGHLLYVKTEATGAGTPGMYVVRPFSINSLTFTGPAHDLYEETPGFAVGMGSRKTLLHSPVVTNSNEAILKRHDLTTSEEGVFVRFVQQMNWPDISPDGSLLVKQEDSGSPIDRRLEVYDLVNDRSFTLVEGDSIFHPTWSHDGTDVYFSRYANDAFSIWKKRSNQTGSETLVLAEGCFQELSPDGSWLAFSKGTNWGDPVRGVFLLDLSSGERRVLDSLSIETHYKAFSGDGRYLVHSRIENGRIALVVRSTDGRDEIPLTSGMAPNWDIKRNRIYFLNEAETILYRVDVRTEPNFTKLGEPEVVFRFPFSGANRYVIDSANEVVYSVSLWDIDLNGPDAILNVIQHFDRYAASLVEGSN